MRFQKSKEVSIWEDLWGWLCTSRTPQWTIVGIVGLVPILIAWHITSYQREAAIAARPVPQQINFHNVSDLEFFDQKTAQPLIWCVKNGTGYVLYNTEGYDPSGIALKAVTKGDVPDIKQWAEQVIAKREEAAKENQIASLQSLFRFSDVPDGTKVFVLGINTSGLPQWAQESCVIQFGQHLVAQLPSQSIKSDVLTEDFYNRGYFDKAYDGNSAFLNEAGVFDHAGHLLLVKAEVRFENASVEGVITCHLTLSCRLYVSGTNETRLAIFDAAGPGFSNQASFKRAMEVLFESNHDKVNQFLTDKL